MHPICARNVMKRGTGRMAEYIEREALIAEYDKAHKGPAGGARKLMVEAPAVDVVKVKHGKWEKANSCVFPVFKCSLCGLSVATGKTYYCPNCGAKMDGGNNDN